MANLSVRKLDDETIRRIQDRAAAKGLSMEEEIRRILRSAVAAPDRLADLASSIFGAEHGVDLDLPRHEPHEAPSLDS